MILLYNPHGSDVTILMFTVFNMTILLYNPHGSDVTRDCRIQNCYFLFLYNPHGSDVTLLINIELEIKETFITHTVQM